MNRMKPQYVRLWSLIAMVAGFLVSLLGSAWDANLVIGIGLLILAGAFIFDLVYCRCPNCGRYLGRDVGNYCPHCGDKFED